MTATAAARAGVSVVVALLAGGLTYLAARTHAYPRDFGQVWFAARAVWRGEDPYTMIGPGLTFHWPWPFYYPLPAAFVGLPFAPLPYAVAMGAFSAVGAGALTWALTAEDFAPLMALLSVSAWNAVTLAQWSPLLTSAVLIAPLQVVLIAKPNIGAAIWCARPSRWAILGGIVLATCAFVAQPAWFGAWRDALSGAHEASGEKFPSMAPVMLPGGFLALAALARWRRPEARLIAALACVPQTLVPAEGLPLFLVPRGMRQASAFVLLNLGMGLWLERSPIPKDIHARLHHFGSAMIVAMYLPATVMVLLRPNVGSLPTWIERRVAIWPSWLRGVPANLPSV